MAKATKTTAGGERQELERLTEEVTADLESAAAVLKDEPIDKRIALALRSIRESIDIVPVFADCADPAELDCWFDGEKRRIAQELLANVASANAAAIAEPMSDAVAEPMSNAEVARQLAKRDRFHWMVDTAIGLAIWGFAAWLFYRLALSQGWLS